MCEDILDVKQDSPEDGLEAGIIVIGNTQIKTLTADEYNILHNKHGLKETFLKTFLWVNLYFKKRGSTYTVVNTLDSKKATERRDCEFCRTPDFSNWSCEIFC